MTAAEAGPVPATAATHRLQTVTSALHGALREDDRSRQEFFALAVGAR